MANIVKLISVRDLLDKKFVIPDYQRGYKWKPQQARDLLDDLYEFMNKLNNSDDDSDAFYCLQPLAVKKQYDLTDFEPFVIDKQSEQSAIEKHLKYLETCAQWEVIDGQQRLTTIKLLLTYLNAADKLSISYVTRPESEKYLDDINNSKENFKENSDFYHMHRVYDTFDLWFKETLCEIKENGEFNNCDYIENYKFNKIEQDLKKNFTDLLVDSDRVQFIWYECNDEDPIKVFTRLNIGKIGLTNAELIKAILLKQSNFEGKDALEIAAFQREIASEWDNIEKTLQNDEFWYFIHNKGETSPTRIDYIFDIVCKKKLLGEPQKKIGNDKYRSFRYVDFFFGQEKCKKGEYPKNNKTEKPIERLEICWGHVKYIFQAFTDWYNDLVLYHYIGFLISIDNDIVYELCQKWSATTKDGFVDYLVKKISEQIKGGNNKKNNNKTLEEILNQQYAYEDGDSNLPSKTLCKPILLLHNIQTIINQNKVQDKDKKYKVPAFYKFPFHQYKNEKWDVEHIDSNITNNLKDDYDKILWLFQYYKNRTLIDLISPIPIEVLDQSIYNIIEDVLKRIINNNANEPVLKKWKWPNSDIEKNCKWYNSSLDDDAFQQIQNLITGALSKAVRENVLNDQEKNQIWNFTLLDSGTNRSYGNSIFPAKRREIMAKDCQMKIKLIYDNNVSCSDQCENLKFEEEPSTESAFIPPVTRNVFMKYYTPDTQDFYRWDRNDADAYKKNIKNTLEKIIDLK